jgi:hypothetical protein
MEEYFKKTSEQIKPGKEYTMYMTYCTACKQFKRIHSGAPAGPGGTLSCPICRSRKENGPGIERSYGRVKVKSFTIILPEDVDIENDKITHCNGCNCMTKTIKKSRAIHICGKCGHNKCFGDFYQE